MAKRDTEKKHGLSPTDGNGILMRIGTTSVVIRYVKQVGFIMFYSMFLGGCCLVKKNHFFGLFLASGMSPCRI